MISVNYCLYNTIKKYDCKKVPKWGKSAENGRKKAKKERSGWCQ